MLGLLPTLVMPAGAIPNTIFKIEGFEVANDPTLMGRWIGTHSKRMRVITCGFDATVHNPLRTTDTKLTTPPRPVCGCGFNLPALSHLGCSLKTR